MNTKINQVTITFNVLVSGTYQILHHHKTYTVLSNTNNYVPQKWQEGVPVTQFNFLTNSLMTFLWDSASTELIPWSTVLEKVTPPSNILKEIADDLPDRRSEGSVNYAPS